MRPAVLPPLWKPILKATGGIRGPASAATRNTNFTPMAGVRAVFMENRSDLLVIRFFPDLLALSIRRRFPLAWVCTKHGVGIQHPAPYL